MKYLWLILITLVLGGCTHQEDDAPEKPVVSVRVARPTESEVRLILTAPASVFPRAQANVSPRLTAHIQELRVRKGDSVDKGQVMAVLENRDLLAQRDEASATLVDAEASLQKLSTGTLPSEVEKARGQVVSAEAAPNQAQKNYTRRNELYKQGAIPGRDLLSSETDLAQAKAAYDVAKRTLDLLEHQSREQDLKIAQSQVEQAKARLANIEIQLQFSEIRSPFAGTITEQFMYPGDLATPSNPVFTVMDLSVAIARAQVPESEAGSVRSGQSCSFASLDTSGTGIGGRITVVNRAVDPAKRTVEVWCETSNTDKKLRAGAFGNVNVTTGSVPNALLVPATAVQFTEGTRSGSVSVVDAKQVAHQVQVETGERSGANVQITKGLKPADLVIVEGGYGLPDGTQVKTSEIGK